MIGDVFPRSQDESRMSCSAGANLPQSRSKYPAITDYWTMSSCLASRRQSDRPVYVVRRLYACEGGDAYLAAARWLRHRLHR
jgi:hypothetical protein